MPVSLTEKHHTHYLNIVNKNTLKKHFLKHAQTGFLSPDLFHKVARFALLFAFEFLHMTFLHSSQFLRLFIHVVYGWINVSTRNAYKLFEGLLLFSINNRINHLNRYKPLERVNISIFWTDRSSWQHLPQSVQFVQYFIFYFMTSNNPHVISVTFLLLLDGMLVHRR